VFGETVPLSLLRRQGIDPLLNILLDQGDKVVDPKSKRKPHRLLEVTNDGKIRVVSEGDDLFMNHKTKAALFFRQRREKLCQRMGVF